MLNIKYSISVSAVVFTQKFVVQQHMGWNADDNLEPASFNTQDGDMTASIMFCLCTKILVGHAVKIQVHLI